MPSLKSTKSDSTILSNLGIIWKWAENIYINFITIVFIRLNILSSELVIVVISGFGRGFSFLTRYCMYRSAIYTIKLPPVIIIYNFNALYKLENSMCFIWFFYGNKYLEQFKLTLSILDWFNKFMSLRNYVLTAHIVCLKLILIYNKD